MRFPVRPASRAARATRTSSSVRLSAKRGCQCTEAGTSSSAPLCANRMNSRCTLDTRSAGAECSEDGRRRSGRIGIAIHHVGHLPPWRPLRSRPRHPAVHAERIVEALRGNPSCTGKAQGMLPTLLPQSPTRASSRSSAATVASPRAQASANAVKFRRVGPAFTSTSLRES